MVSPAKGEVLAAINAVQRQLKRQTLPENVAVAASNTMMQYVAEIFLDTPPESPKVLDMLHMHSFMRELRPAILGAVHHSVLSTQDFFVSIRPTPKQPVSVSWERSKLMALALCPYADSEAVMNWIELWK